MTDDAVVLRELNESFYRALEGLDLEAMDKLWAHERWARCVHPGSDVIVGWEDIRRSWQQIFAGTRWLRVTPTSVDVKVLGNVGFVACSENITAANESDVGLAVAQATNLFHRTPAGWRLVIHHASPAPVEVTGPETGNA